MAMGLEQLKAALAGFSSSQRKEAMREVDNALFDGEAFFQAVKASKDTPEGNYVVGYCPERHAKTRKPQVWVRCPICEQNVARQACDVHTVIGDFDPKHRWDNMGTGCPACKAAGRSGKNTEVGLMAKFQKLAKDKGVSDEEIERILAKVAAKA
jgi:hypothetical protein